VSGVRILAEMQTPSQSVSLQLQSSAPDEGQGSSKPGSSLQNIVRFDLKEEGNHVLAVNVSYTETTQGDGSATSGKVRSFRKLYQFVAQPCLSVRTKGTELASIEVADRSLGPYGKSSLLKYALEAQLENVSDNVIVLEAAKFHPRAPFKSVPLNWDSEHDGNDEAETPTLNPRDVLQIAFFVEQEQGNTDGLDDLRASLRQDGRAALGHLSVLWRSGMGERGSLSTGNLLSRRRVS